MHGNGTDNQGNQPGIIPIGNAPRTIARNKPETRRRNRPTPTQRSLEGPTWRAKLRQSTSLRTRKRCITGQLRDLGIITNVRDGRLAPRAERRAAVGWEPEGLDEASSRELAMLLRTQPHLGAQLQLSSFDVNSYSPFGFGKVGVC